jgi:predicted metalloprotease with PDZ domain
VDRARLIAALSRIAHAGIQLFGSTPFRRYLFFYHVGGGGFYGGLEHRSSTVIHMGDPIRGAGEDGFLTTTAHEFFHAWNVKRLRPAVLGPFDYTQPVHTGALWWAEGVTDYYAQLLLVRAGLRSRDWFLKVFTDRIAELDTTPARVRVTLEEASRNAWEGGSIGYDGLSYYLKGSLVGFYFDLRLRELTGGRKSLDDVMRALDARYGRHDIGYPEEGLLNTLNDVARADLTTEYTRYVRGTDEIYWDRVLTQAGLSLHRDRVAYLGVRLVNAPPPPDNTTPPAIVESVLPGFAAANMALQAGDKILRINGTAVTAGTLGDLVRALPPIRPLTLDIERDNAPLTLNGDSGLAYINHALTVLPEGQIPDSARRLRASLFARIAAVSISPKPDTRYPNPGREGRAAL